MRWVSQTSPWSSDEYMTTVDLRQMFPAADQEYTRNQGECRSCWAVVAAEHFQAVMVTTTVTDKREMQSTEIAFDGQQIIDCDTSPDDHGCDGGTVSGAFDYMVKNGVVASNKYPNYLDGTKHACAMDKVPASVPRYTPRSALFLVPPCLEATCPPNKAYEDRLLDFWDKSPYVNADKTKYFPIPVVAYVDARSGTRQSEGGGKGNQMRGSTIA